MNVENFPANSQKSKDAEVVVDGSKPSINGSDSAKKIEKIITGEVVRRKKPVSRRFMETFFGGDSKDVMSYVIFEVLIPAAKSTIADAIQQAVERTLFGGSRPSSRRPGFRPSGSTGYVNYNLYSSPIGRRDDQPSQTLSMRARATHNFDEIVLPSRDDAERVIDSLFEIISKYNQATLVDLYDLVGVQSSYTDRRWGWTDLRGAGATRINNGYLLDLPRPEQLER